MNARTHPNLEEALRASLLARAGALIREARINTLGELYQMLHTVYTNAEKWGDVGDFCEMLSKEVLMPMDDVVNPIQPELSGYDKRGEYDMHTVGVKDRG